ncbi:Serine/threonine protein kinase [Giardia duodenalis assemblage B]|uniref:Serine/threonine protein kinase n=1 Tax=Giardia duodenalis assemblage B TaxID=1394984 RepID=A0A132NMJ5_GIAIN|nr:Serine/threonine protein kinase [Giardia intestinalis assemblage B]
MSAYALDPRAAQQIIPSHSCDSGRTSRNQAGVISSRPSHRSVGWPLGTRGTMSCSTSSRHEAISGSPTGLQQADRPVEGLLVVPRWKPVSCAASSIAGQLAVHLRRRASYSAVQHEDYDWYTIKRMQKVLS